MGFRSFLWSPMDIFNSSMLQKESKEYMDKLVGAIESALYPFKTGGVTIWYEDALDGFQEIIVTVEIKTLGRLRLRFDKTGLLDSYLDAATVIAIEIHEHIKNRPRVEVDNPNIILGTD